MFGRVIAKFLSVERLDGFVLYGQGWRKTSSSKFLAAWKRWRIVHKGRTFSYKYVLDFKEKDGKNYWNAGRLVILGPCLAAGCLVTSLQERQRHWQFALHFLFAALHGQQSRSLFRVQAALHGQETSTDPWSYLIRMANFI